MLYGVSPFIQAYTRLLCMTMRCVPKAYVLAHITVLVENILSMVFLAVLTLDIQTAYLLTKQVKL